MPNIDWRIKFLDRLHARPRPHKHSFPVRPPTAGKVDLAHVTYGWFKNSMELGFLKLSENLKDEIRRNPMLEVVGPAEEMEFDGAGNLEGLVAQVPDLRTALSN